MRRDVRRCGDLGTGRDAYTRFGHLLARTPGCELRPDEAISVGDTGIPDAQGPRAVGIRAVLSWRPECDPRRCCLSMADAIRRVEGLPSMVDIADRLSCSAGPVRCG